MLKDGQTTFLFPSIFQWTINNTTSEENVTREEIEVEEEEEEERDSCFIEEDSFVGLVQQEKKIKKNNRKDYNEIITLLSPIISPTELSPKITSSSSSSSSSSLTNNDQCVPMSIDQSHLQEISVESSNSTLSTFSPSQLFKNYNNNNNNNNYSIEINNFSNGISFITNPFQFFKSIRSYKEDQNQIITNSTFTPTATTPTTINSNRINIEELPLEIIVYILGFLDYYDIGLRISMLNHNFKEISNLYFIWKNLYRKKTEPTKIKNKRNKFFNVDINSIYKNKPTSVTTVKTTEMNINTNTDNINKIEPLKEYKQLYKKRTITEKNWKRGICSVQTLYGHQEGVWGVQFHGDRLVSCCEDGVMKVWDINEGECLNTLYGHNDVVNSFHFEKDRVVSGSDDSTLKMWNSNTGQCINTFHGHQGSVWMLEFKDNWLVSGGDDKMVRVWDTNTGQQISTLAGHTGRIYYVQMGNNLVVSGAQDRSCKVWDLRTGKSVHSMTSNSPVHCLQIDGNLWNGDWAVASGHHNGSIGVWNMRTGTLQSVLSNPISCPVWHIQFRNNIIYTSSCNDLNSWNLNVADGSDCQTTSTQLNSNKVFKGHTKSIKHFQVKDNRLVSGGLDNKIKVWDLDKPGNNYLYTLVGHTKSVDWLEFKKDKLISCSADHTIRIWDFNS